MKIASKYGPIEPETLDLYERLTRGISVALDVYQDAHDARRERDARLIDFDVADRPPSRLEVDVALDFAVDLLRRVGDEPTAWLLVQAMALRGGPPRSVMEAVVALQTLHPGGCPPLVETARKAAGSRVGPDVEIHDPESRARSKPVIEPINPYPGDDADWRTT